MLLTGGTRNRQSSIRASDPHYNEINYFSVTSHHFAILVITITILSATTTSTGAMPDVRRR